MKILKYFLRTHPCFCVSAAKCGVICMIGPRPDWVRIGQLGPLSRIKTLLTMIQVGPVPSDLPLKSFRPVCWPTGGWHVSGWDPSLTELTVTFATKRLGC